MKKIIYLTTLIIISYSLSFSHNFEITPLKINFLGVATEGETIIAYGDYGSAVLSPNSGSEWIQKKVFKAGTVIYVYINGKKLTAFNNNGDISVSYDNGANWDNVKSLNDTILDAIKYPGGYFLRTRNNLLTLSEDFEIENEYPLYSRALQEINSYVKPTYRYSLSYFKDKLIAETDSSVFLGFDSELRLTDTLSFNKLGVFDSTYEYISGYRMDSGDDYLYILVIAGEDVLVGDVFRTKDFKTAQKYYDLYAGFSIFKVENNQFYPLNKTEDYLEDSTKLTGHSSSSTNLMKTINDFTVKDNKQIIVGDRKFIELIDLKDTSLNVVSDLSRANSFSAPDRINDSAYVFYSGGYQSKYFDKYLYITTNNAVTLKPSVDTKNEKYEDKYPSYKFTGKYFDKTNKKIYFLGYNEQIGNAGFMLVSDDYGRSFKSHKINDFHIQSSFSSMYDSWDNARLSPNISKNENDNFVVCSGWNRHKDTVSSGISTLNDDYNVVSRIIIRDKVVDYVHSKDTNTFLIHCANAIDSVSEILYTTDKGKKWETIKKYPASLTEKYYQEIEINNEKYFALIHYYIENYHNDAVFFDVLNLQTNEFSRICEWQNPSSSNSKWGAYGVGIASDKDTVYISFEDTLFYAVDLFDKNSWKYQTFPKEGRMYLPLKKFGDKFYAQYDDSDMEFRNAAFWIKPLDSLTSVAENRVESLRNYLYSYPAFPTPAKNEVRSLIYWDTSKDIDKAVISIYNLYGRNINARKIGGKENIRIEKLTSYKGYLIWNCADVDNGVYLINIKHGAASRTIKVMVNK